MPSHGERLEISMFGSVWDKGFGKQLEVVWTVGVAVWLCDLAGLQLVVSILTWGFGGEFGSGWDTIRLMVVIGVWVFAPLHFWFKLYRKFALPLSECC